MKQIHSAAPVLDGARLNRFDSRAVARAAAVLAAASVVASCATAPPKTKHGKEYFSESVYGVKASPRVVEYGQPVPQGGGRYMVGTAYVVKGQVYKPIAANKPYSAIGYASWYGSAFHGRRTANGEVYDMDGLSAASPTMPLPSYARVTNLNNGRSLIVRVNDRGPYERNRVIDLSSMTAEMLDLKGHGTAKVKVDYVGPARLEGGDKRMLLATYRGPNSNSGNTMLAMRAPSADPAVLMAQQAGPPVLLAAAPVPRSRPGSGLDGGVAINPYGFAVAAARQPGSARIARPTVDTADMSSGPGAPPQTLGSYTANAPVAYSSTPADDTEGYYVPDLTPGRSSYAPDAIATPAQKAVNAVGQHGTLQRALNAAVDQAAAERSTDLPVIQVGIFSDLGNARAVAARLAKLGTVSASEITIGGRSMQSVKLIVTERSMTGEQMVAAVAAAGAPGAYLVKL